MNKHYTDICLKCKNLDNCYIAKMLSDSGNEFDDIELSDCIGFVEIVQNIIKIHSCKECKNRGYTDSADFCKIYKMSKDTYKQITNVNTIPDWCKLLKK